MVGKATLKITANNNNVQISNFGSNSFQITNTGDKVIAQVDLDVTNALYPDSVFAPDTQAGDSAVKPLTIDTTGNTGVGAPSASSYIGAGGKAGFKGLRLVFNPAVSGGFNPGETVGFSIDMDPNSIAGSSKTPLDAGASPAWDVGGVSGAELIGSTFTVTFTDGTTATGQLQGDKSQGGAQGLASQDSPNLPVSLTVNGLGAGGLGTYNSSGPSVIVSGPAGQTARVVLTKGFIQPVTPYAQFLANQLALLATKEFPANNAVEFQTVDIVLTGGNQDISGLFNFSGVANYNFAGENQLPLGFVASVIDPTNGSLPIGSVTKPIYLKFANQTQVSIAATTNAAEPASNGLFTVSLSQAATTNTVVAYSVAGTATAGADYTVLTGTVTIAAGSLAATIPVSVLDDQAVEGSESVIVTLTGLTGLTDVVLGTTKTATVAIADNEVAKQVSIAATTQTSEPAINGLFTVSLSQAATTNTVVAYSVAGTATAGTDYTALTGTVTIAAGSLSATIPVSVLDDQAVEGSESVVVTLTGASGSNTVLGATTSATVNIADDEIDSTVVVAINAGGPTLTQNGITFVADTAFLNGGTYTDGTFDADQPVFNGTIYETERNSGSALGTFNYSIPVAPGNYTVELYFAEIFQTTPGTRVFDVSVEGQLVLDNLDILAQNGGNINQPYIFTVPVTVSPNTFGAPGAIDISFSASVDQAKVSGIVIRSANVSTNAVTIAATTQASEPGTNGLFTVSLAQAATTPTIVTYSVGGTATAGSDYTALTGTVTIPANQLSATIAVPVLDDLAVEGSESVIVTLTGATGPTGVVLGATTAATVTIADNDSPPPTTTLTVQAESLTNLTGYRLESNSFATGGSMLSLIGGAANETGTATFAFAGATGNYKVILGTFDENDGVATLSVAKNGASIGSVLLNQNLGNASAVAATKVEKSVTTGVAIANGDIIKVTGVENAGEVARFDFIRFESAGPAVPAVSIAATTNAAEPSSNGLFTVNLSQVATTNTVVAYSIGGTATAGADYTALSGTVTVLANQLSATIPVSVLDDLVSEGSESVIVTLTGATGSNAVLGATKTATVSIADNESLPPSTLTFQAETANTIVNYRNESIGVALGGQVLSFVGGASGESGSASFVFGDTPDEVTGTYNMVLGTFDENDGVASFTVQLTDFETKATTQIGSLLLNANLGSAVANAQTTVSPIVATGISLTPGDIIKVNGFENGLEHARFDFLKLMPV